MHCEITGRRDTASSKAKNAKYPQRFQIILTGIERHQACGQEPN